MNQVISGNALATLCDHVFSQTLVDQTSNSGYRIFLNPNVVEKIESGQTVFVKTDYLLDFFRMIRTRSNLCNVKLVTHDSDKIIDHNITRNIPTCISRMFSMNVCTNDSRIVPIPIGIANDYCSITLKPNVQKRPSAKGTKALIACNIKNNLKERLPLYTHKFDSNVTVIKDLVDVMEYEQLLNDYDFVFCPEGNGPDTHRVWETLYMGKIPIVKNSIWNSTFRNLPILFVDNFLDCNEMTRANFVNSNFLNLALDKSTLVYWKELIRNHHNEPDPKKISSQQDYSI